MTELSSHNEDHLACQAYNTYYRALYSKSLLTHDLERLYLYTWKLTFNMSPRIHSCQNAIPLKWLYLPQSYTGEKPHSHLLLLPPIHVYN